MCVCLSVYVCVCVFTFNCLYLLRLPSELLQNWNRHFLGCRIDKIELSGKVVRTHVQNKKSDISDSSGCVFPNL